MEYKELLKAVTVDKDNYDPVAIDIMNKELKKRDVDNGNKEEFQETYLQEKKASMNSGKLFCPKCYCLNIKKQKPFWAFFFAQSADLFINSQISVFGVWLPISICSKEVIYAAR